MTTQPRRRLRSDERRARILDAGTDVFTEVGYEAASMERIAAGAGVTRPVLYDHFRSKRELYLSLLERQRDELLGFVMERAVEAKLAPEARVRVVVENFFAFVEEHPGTWRLLFRDVVGDPEVSARQAQLQREASVALTGRLLGPAGPFRALGKRVGGRAEVLAQVWGGAMHEVARWWYSHREVTREALVRSVMEALWIGLARLLDEADGEVDRAPGIAKLPSRDERP